MARGTFAHSRAIGGVLARAAYVVGVQAAPFLERAAGERFPAAGAVPRLTIERKPECGIEVERGALAPGFSHRLPAKGRASVVEVRSERGS